MMGERQTSLDILVSARQLLSDQIRWTKWSAVRDSFGRDCEFDSKYRASYCLLGAIRQAAYEEGMTQHELENQQAYLDAVATVSEEIGTTQPGSTMFSIIMRYNDAPECRHSDVLRLLDRCINRLERQDKGQ